MSRKLKRVPLDFAQPLNKVWEGYLPPREICLPCPERDKTCFNGSTAAGQWFYSVCRFLATLGGDAITGRRTHPWIEAWPWRPDAPLTPDLHALILGLAKGRSGIMGPDDWAIGKTLAEAAGLAKGWDYCPVCKGTAMDSAVQKEHDAWEPTEPPTGEGFQLWEDVSEGSPVSPVFASLDELCAWCETGATTFATHRTTAAEWKRMLVEDSVCHVDVLPNGTRMVHM